MKLSHPLAVILPFFALGLTAFASENAQIQYTYATPSDGPLEEEVEQHEAKTTIRVPLLLQKDGVSLMSGVDLQANVWSFDQAPVGDIELYKIKVPFSAIYPVSDKLPLVVTLVPGLHSDLEDVDSDDVRLEGSAMSTYRYSETLSIILGVGFGEEFGDAQAFPLAGIKWQATESLQVDLFFPKPKISYAVSEGFRVYLAAEPTGGEWNVGKDGPSYDVRQEGFRIGAGAELQVLDNGWLFAGIGSEVNRTLDIAQNGNPINQEEIELDDQTFVQVGFRLK